MADRQQLEADLKAAELNLEAAQHLYDEAFKAVYELNFSEWQDKHGIREGDKLLGTQEFIDLLHGRRQSTVEFSRWGVGDEYIFNSVSLHNDMCNVSKFNDGGTGNIPVDMIKRMRAAWVARQPEAVSNE